MSDTPETELERFDDIIQKARKRYPFSCRDLYTRDILGFEYAACAIGGIARVLKQKVAYDMPYMVSEAFPSVTLFDCGKAIRINDAEGREAAWDYLRECIINKADDQK